MGHRGICGPRLQPRRDQLPVLRRSRIGGPTSLWPLGRVRPLAPPDPSHATTFPLPDLTDHTVAFPPPQGKLHYTSTVNSDGDLSYIRSGFGTWVHEQY